MTFEELGINLRHSSGQEKTNCPKCSHTRKKGSDPCLSVNIDEGVYKCHHCGWSGTINKSTENKERPIVKPEEPLTDLPDEVISWFKPKASPWLTSNSIVYIGILRSIAKESITDLVAVSIRPS